MGIISVIGTCLHWVSPSAAQRARRQWALTKKQWALRRPGAPWNKAHLINHLARVRGYRHYLEVCTPTSGGRYAEIKRSKFATCVRLMYQCPHSYDDGMTIDYRSTGLDITECLTRMREDGRRVDIALLDSFHEYEPSLRDLREVFGLISDGGTLVVHDCLPPTTELAQPKFIHGEWCGVTYQAFIDYVSDRDDLEFYTVDTDYGCGIIRKRAKASPAAIAGAPSINHTAVDARSQTVANWQTQRDDPWAAFSFFEAHKKDLMNLISVDEFLAKNSKRTRNLAGLWT